MIDIRTYFSRGGILFRAHLVQFAFCTEKYWFSLYGCNFLFNIYCMKSVRMRSFISPYFPVCGMNTERYEVFMCIQSECGKIRTRKIPN